MVTGRLPKSDVQKVNEIPFVGRQLSRKRRGRERAASALLASVA